MQVARGGFHTIHNRLFLLFLTFMLGLLIILSALYYKRTTDDFHAKIGSIARNNVSQTVELLDLLLENYDGASKSIIGNVDLQRLLMEQPKTKDPAVRIINERMITNMLGAVFYSQENLNGIHIFTFAGTVYSYQNYLSSIKPDYATADWYRQVKGSTGEMVWLGIQPESLIDPLAKQPVFAFGRLIYDLYEQQPIGIMLMEVEGQAILRAIANLSLGPNSEVVITSADNRVMASFSAEKGLQTDVEFSSARLPHPTADREVIVDETQTGRLVVAAKPTQADWILYSLTPDQDLNVELHQTRRFLYIVVAILIVVATLLATWVSRSIANPLKRVIQGMRHAEHGNFRRLTNVKSYQEINTLIGTYNQMVARIAELIERIRITSASEKNAQLQALQSQVNPHFLYNTLDMIYWMLDEKEEDRLGRVVLALSHMFRYSSHWEEGAQVALREELEQIQHYLAIIELRLGGRLQVELNVEERWLDTVRLPKMTLQPIIENAVKYGLERLDRPGVLSLWAEAGDGRLSVVIADNGNGMEEAQLLRLTGLLQEETRRAMADRERLAELGGDDAPAGAAGAIGGAGAKAGRPGPAAVPGEAPAAVPPHEPALPPARRGIGLQNLQRRLVLMFGAEAGLQVESRPDEGTTVRIVLPLPGGQTGGEAE